MAIIRTTIGGLPAWADNEPITQRGNLYGDAYQMGHGDQFWAVLEKPDLAASEGFILVDLSNTADFPHTETGKIRVYSVYVDIERGEAAASGEFLIDLGVITRVDATNGDTKWVAVMHEETDDEATDNRAKWFYRYEWAEGLDLEISGGAPVMGVSNIGHTNDVTWQTDVNLDSPIGDTVSPPGVGDLVLYVSETGGTGTLSVCVTVYYITEAV